MAMVLKRFTMWFLVLAVALSAAYMGFQLAQGQSVADIGQTIGIDTTTHKDSHGTPQACYRAAPNSSAREKNKHC